MVKGAFSIALSAMIVASIIATASINAALRGIRKTEYVALHPELIQ